MIHEAKPPRRTEGEGATEEGKKSYPPREEHKKHSHGEHQIHRKESKDADSDDDGFEHVDNEGRKRGERRGGAPRGGAPRGGRGGAFRADEQHQERKAPKEEERTQPAPKKEAKQAVALPSGATQFTGWGATNLF